MTKPLSSEHRIGSIVTLKSHYTRGEKEYLDEISILGDDNSVPPYMIVTEILKETKNNFDQDTGENSIKKGSFRLKVVWFNAKKYEFNERWINSSFVDSVKSGVSLKVYKPEKFVNLKKYDSNKNEITSNFFDSLKTKSFKKSSQVILKTNPLEIKKNRISFKHEDWNTKISKSSLLSFCAPEMIVIGKSKFKPKDPVFDKITNDKIREIPSDQIKVQYYNPIADKYSEHILPLECFESADEKTDVLTQLIESSKDEKSLVGIKDQLFRVKNISYLHGIYMIQTENFIDETEKSFMLKEIVNLKKIKAKDVIGELLAPKWKGDDFISINKYLDLKTEKKTIKDSEKKTKLESRPIISGSTYYIHYKNLKGKFTKRFISVLNIDDFTVKGKKEDDKILKGYMVQTYCYLRKEERTFTFTDERLLAIYDVKNESEVNSNKLKFKERLSKILCLS